MIDLHTHTIFSDGELLPSELAQRCQVMGFTVLAITDHVDASNLSHVVPRIVEVCNELNKYKSIKVIPGVEITHIPIESMSDLVKKARSLGAKIVVVHGETIVEPVPSGTNQAAILAGIDILAHPGLITEEEVILAKEHSVFLEISGRKGHSLCNGHVVSLAKKIGARLVLNSDSHSPGDLISKEMAIKILKGAGLDLKGVLAAQKNSMEIVERLQ